MISKDFLSFCLIFHLILQIIIIIIIITVSKLELVEVLAHVLHQLCSHQKRMVVGLSMLMVV